MDNLDELILTHLLFDEVYLRKVLPFLKEEYFKDVTVRKIFSKIYQFVEKFGNSPSLDALTVQFQNDHTLDESEYSTITEALKSFKPVDLSNTKWLISETEQYCQKRAIHIALMKSVEIMGGTNTQYTQDAIPSILSDALGVCFDPNVGMDYVDAAEDRFTYYNDDTERISCDLSMFNKITNGGIPRKTLNVIQGGIHAGKTLILCHLATAYQQAGYNVLYITLEMSEHQISSRLDANILNIPISDLSKVSHDDFIERLEKFKIRSPGKLIVKEYPTGSGHVGHFRALLSELKTKRKFVPDVLIVDYLNICASAKIKNNGNANTYVIVKSIAEELRGLAMERDVICWSATQATRAGSEKTEPGMTDVSESFGTPATSDLYISVVNTEELAKMNQLMFIQNKNRYRNFMVDHRFVVGVDVNHMRLYDSDAPTQDLLPDEVGDVKVYKLSSPSLENEPLTTTSTKFRNKRFADIKT